jgi:hypothetical protein
MTRFMDNDEPRTTNVNRGTSMSTDIMSNASKRAGSLIGFDEMEKVEGSKVRTKLCSTTVHGLKDWSRALSFFPIPAFILRQLVTIMDEGPRSKNHWRIRTSLSSRRPHSLSHGP